MNERQKHPLESEVTESQPIDWQGDGVLWLINATVFHPRGFALGMKADGSGPVLLGNGSEAWSFDRNHTPTPDELLVKVEALFARARAQNKA